MILKPSYLSQLLTGTAFTRKQGFPELGLTRMWGSGAMGRDLSATCPWLCNDQEGD